MNIPAVILELTDYRKKILEEEIVPEKKTATAEEQVDAVESLIKGLKQPDIPDSSTVQDRVRLAFEWVLDNLGYDEFYNMAVRLKRIEGLTGADYNLAKGELAETFLFLTIKQYLKAHNITKWHVYHHLLVPFISGNGSTELDVVMVSTTMIVVFESKSFNGKKLVDKECFIKTPHSRTDVFKQNALHCKALWENIQSLNISDIGAMKSVFFNFSLGDTEDRRTADNKRRMPHVNEKNIMHFLNAVTAENRIAWRGEVNALLKQWADRGYDPEAHVREMTNRRKKPK